MISTDFCQSQSCVTVVVVVVVCSSESERVFFQRAVTYVIQESVHPSVDGHPSDGVVDEVDLPGHQVSVSVTSCELYSHHICNNVTSGVMGCIEGACIYDAVIHSYNIVLVCIINSMYMCYNLQHVYYIYIQVLMLIEPAITLLN